MSLRENNNTGNPGGTTTNARTEPPDIASNRDCLDAKPFTNIFMTSPVGIFIVQDRKLCFVNPEFQRISGYSEDELLAMESSMLVLPEDWPRIKANAKMTLKGERTTPYLYRAVDKKGDIKWIIESVTSIRYGGKPAVLGYFMDNTDREHANEALGLSEEKFHKAFRSSPDWIVISTLEDGFYVDVNEAFIETTGYRRDEVIGRTSIELGIWADPQQRKEMVKVLHEQKMVRNLEAQFRMKSGEIRFVLWSAEVIDYGDEKCLIAVTRDITARKREEKERLEKEKLQGVLEIAGATCHELNQPLQYVYYLLDEILEENPDSKAAKELKKQCDRMKEVTTKMENITTYETTEYVRGEKMIDINKASKI
ncbi:MAG: PAS domain-containing protein [Desulfatiglandaceae bacterium]